MKLKEIISENKKIEAPKPRNFVAKNAKVGMGGAGAHRDKKKEQKQGYEKHKSKSVAEAGDVSHLHKALDRALSKEKKASPAQVQRNKERWAKRQAERGQGVAEGSLDESKIHNVIMAFAVLGGALIGGASGIQSHQNKQRWMQAYEQIKQTDPATAEQVKQLVNKYKSQPLKWGPDIDSSRKIEKIISDFENQKLKDQLPEQGVAESVLDLNKRHQLIKYLAKTLGWEINYLELASDDELLDLYQQAKSGKLTKQEGTEMEGRHGYDDFGFSLAPGHDEGEPVYNPHYDRSGSYDRKSRYSQDYNYKTGKPLGSEPKKTGYMFYNVNDELTARKLGLRQTKSGKWYLPADDTFRQATADKVFGKGRYWEPK